MATSMSCILHFIEISELHTNVWLEDNTLYLLHNITMLCFSDLLDKCEDEFFEWEQWEIRNSECWPLKMTCFYSNLEK